MSEQLTDLLEIINGEDYTLAARLLDQTIYKAKGIGVRPIIEKMRIEQKFFANAIVTDKIIGKAAALLLVLSQAQYVHGKIMSDSAIAVFETHDIPYSFGKRVEHIANRDHSGICPLEQSVLDIDDPVEGFAAIEMKIKELMGNK